MTPPRFVCDSGGPSHGAVADESVLRVAACQDVSLPGDVGGNVAAAARLVGLAAQAGARVAVLPELFLTGYDPACWTDSNVVGADDPRLGPLSAACRDAGVVAVVGTALPPDSSATPPPGHPPNSQTNRVGVVVVGGDGRVHEAYAKQHLSGPEQDHFTPGSSGASVHVDGWQLGLGVCYDGCFPEHAMEAAAAGAQAYLVPAAHYVGAEHRRDLYYPARALDNGIYVVFAGLTGPCGDGVFSGGSAVHDPEGRTLAKADEAAPALAVADLRLAEVRRVQEHVNPVAHDREALLGWSTWPAAATRSNLRLDKASISD